MWGMCAVILNSRLITAEKNVHTQSLVAIAPVKVPTSSYKFRQMVVHQSFEPLPPLIFISLCFPGGRVHFFADEQRFTFNLSVVAFSCRLVIWTFDINYLRSSRSPFLLLEMLFKVWWEDLRKAVTVDSTQGTLVWTAEYQRVGTSLAFTLTLSGCPCYARGGMGWGYLSCLLLALQTRNQTLTQTYVSVHVIVCLCQACLISGPQSAIFAFWPMSSLTLQEQARGSAQGLCSGWCDADCLFSTLWQAQRNKLTCDRVAINSGMFTTICRVT